MFHDLQAEATAHAQCGASSRMPGSWELRHTLRALSTAGPGDLGPNLSQVHGCWPNSKCEGLALMVRQSWGWGVLVTQHHELPAELGEE